MSRLRNFVLGESGAAAAEFALILPVALLFLLGTIDIGRYFWAINEGEKAVQMGARYAVATKVITPGLNDVSYVGFTCPAGQLKAGETICREALGTISCSGTGNSVSCNCTEDPTGGAASCPDLGTPRTEAFNAIVRRMQVVDERIAPGNVRVSYSGSGLGFAGDPATDSNDDPLSEISPVTTVEIRGLSFRSISLLGYGITLPDFRYSLTLEDGDGGVAY
ncbi:MAG: TadE family protein [Novosphingobium sp.]